MFFMSSMTLPIDPGSMPRTSAPDVFDAHEAITSPRTTGVAADDAGHEPHVVEHVLPVVEAADVAGVDRDVRVVAEDLALQVLAEAAHDRRHAAERARADRDAQDREHGDDREKSALARAHVAHGDERPKTPPLEPIEEPGHEADQREDDEPLRRYPRPRTE